MSLTGDVEIIRSTLFHTPENPFVSGVLRHYSDGGLAIAGGRIVTCGDFSDVRAAHPDAAVEDWRGGFVLPGLIDTHIHFPQIRVLGSFGYPLLEWLDRFALPEEARFADPIYAGHMAHDFVESLVAHGTTTVLAFGSHFVDATAALFEAAASCGIRLFSGLVLSDRALRPELLVPPGRAYDASKDLIRRFHGRGRLGYAVIPRFALSTSEAMLELCRDLLREPGLRFTTHINENTDEVQQVAKQFPWSKDYLDVYQRFDLITRASVLAHNVHVTDSQLDRISSHSASIAHCPCSNASLGSGIFPMLRHVRQGVRFALGTDVGGGTGFGILKEALQSYLMQRIAPEPVALGAAHLLYLATRAGAEALMMEQETGDFGSGKAADLVYLRPPDGSVLHSVLAGVDDSEHVLASLFLLADTATIRQVRVGGDIVFQRPGDDHPSN